MSSGDATTRQLIHASLGLLICISALIIAMIVILLGVALGWNKIMSRRSSVQDNNQQMELQDRPTANNGMNQEEEILPPPCPSGVEDVGVFFPVGCCIRKQEDNIGTWCLRPKSFFSGSYSDLESTISEGSQKGDTTAEEQKVDAIKVIGCDNFNEIEDTGGQINASPENFNQCRLQRY